MYMVQYVSYDELEAAIEEGWTPSIDSMELLAGFALQLSVSFRPNALDCLVWVRKVAAESYNDTITPPPAILTPIRAKALGKIEMPVDPADVTFDQAVVHDQFVRALYRGKVLGWFFIRPIGIGVANK